MPRTTSTLALCLLVVCLAAPAVGQTPRPWLVSEMLSAAKSEGGTLTVYASMNEEEALPYWSVFEQATGIKVDFLRMSDASIRARVAIEHRAGQRTWDLVATNLVNHLGNEILAQSDPPQAKELIPQARDPNRRWYGVAGNYNAPAYNTNMIKPGALPRSYEEFLEYRQWARKIAIDATDSEWLSAMFMHYGEERGKKLVGEIARALEPVVIDGHLNLARQVVAGEYWLALNNYVPLTVNLKLAGGPTDFWALDPVALVFAAVGINSRAPHPATALLAVNFMLSREGQAFLTRKGRLPTRPDVATNPPDVMDILRQRKIVVPVTSAAEHRRMQQAFNEIFRSR